MPWLVPGLFYIKNSNMIIEINLTKIEERSRDELESWVADLLIMKLRSIVKGDYEAAKAIGFMKGIIDRELEDRAKLGV